MRHVLIIEDEPLIADTMAEMALAAGASSVAIADSEGSAVEEAGRHMPRIIVSDVDLHAGGRGPRAVALIQEMYGSIPAIFVTGSPNDDDVRRMGSAVLSKPVVAETFFETFKDTFHLATDPRLNPARMSTPVGRPQTE